jgi:hypothetical protein
MKTTIEIDDALLLQAKRLVKAGGQLPLPWRERAGVRGKMAKVKNLSPGPIILRIVVASPGDVQAERDVLAKAAEGSCW